MATLRTPDGAAVKDSAGNEIKKDGLVDDDMLGQGFARGLALIGSDQLVPVSLQELLGQGVRGSGERYSSLFIVRMLSETAYQSSNEK